MRVKYDRADLTSTGPAAQKLAADGQTRYIIATAYGYKILAEQPPALQLHIIVNPDGSHHYSDEA